MIDYKAEWNTPLHAEYKGETMWTVPAPASGAIWLLVMGMLSRLDTEGPGYVKNLHRMMECLRVGLRSFRS